MAAPLSTTVTPAPVGIATDPEAQAEYTAALNQQLKALEGRQTPNWFKIAAGFSDPGRGGSFFESLGSANAAAAKDQEEQEARAPGIAQMRAAIAGQKFEMNKQAKALDILAGSMPGVGNGQQIASMISNGQIPAGFGTKFTPETYLALQQLYPKLAEGYKNAATMDADRYKLWQEDKKIGLTEREQYEKYGKPVVDAYSSKMPTSTQSPIPTAPVASGKIEFDPNGTYGTPSQILDNVNQIESSGGKNLLNPTSKALGPYQFTPETLVDLHNRGVQFNPLDAKQSRSAADWYLSELYKKTGSWEKALAAYGGFQKTDPTNYVSQALKGVDPNTGLKTQTINKIDQLYQDELQRIADNPSLSPDDRRKAQVEAQNRLAARQSKEAEQRTEINTAQEKAFQQGLGTENVKSVIKIRNDSEIAQGLLPLINNQISLVDSRPTAFGWLSDPSLSSALIADANSAYAKGVQITPQRIAQYLGGVTDPEDLKAINLYLNNAGQINLEFAKIDLKGQGSVSDSERKLVSIIGGLPSESPDVIMIKADALKQRFQRDVDLHNAWSDFHEANPSASYDKFLRSSNYIDVKNKYTKIFDDMRDATSKLLQANSSQSSQKSPPKKGSLEERINQLGDK